MPLFFYLFTFTINLWHQKFVMADVTAVFVNSQHGIDILGLIFHTFMFGSWCYRIVSPLRIRVVPHKCHENSLYAGNSTENKFNMIQFTSVVSLGP